MAKSAKNKNVTFDRRKRASRLNDLVPKEARRYMRKMGFTQTEIVTHWGDIVGQSMAERTLPERLTFPRGKRNKGTLYIACDAGWALELQHLQPLLLERINGFFGYKAVAKISVSQTPQSFLKKRMPQAKKDIVLNDDDQKQLTALIGNTKDDDMRAILERLGKAVFANEKK